MLYDEFTKKIDHNYDWSLIVWLFLAALFELSCLLDVWCVVSQQEIVSLYQRFCQLDRNGGGFISSDEFMTVPEFAVNPLSQVRLTAV